MRLRSETNFSPSQDCGSESWSCEDFSIIVATASIPTSSDDHDTMPLIFGSKQLRHVLTFFALQSATCGAYGIRCLRTVWTPSFNHLRTRAHRWPTVLQLREGFRPVLAPNTSVEIVLDLSHRLRLSLLYDQKDAQRHHPVDCLLSYISDRYKNWDHRKWRGILYLTPRQARNVASSSQSTSCCIKRYQLSISSPVVHIASLATCGD